MKKLEFILNNYHSIKSADITLNGITVLSGINGSGKSTVLRWLYYSIYGLKEYKSYAIKKYADALLYTLFADIDRGFDFDLGISIPDEIESLTSYDRFIRYYNINLLIGNRRLFPIISDHTRISIANRITDIEYVYKKKDEETIQEIDDLIDNLLTDFKLALLKLKEVSDSNVKSYIKRYQDIICSLNLPYIDSNKLKKLTFFNFKRNKNIRIKNDEEFREKLQKHLLYNIDIDVLIEIISLYFNKKRDNAKEILNLADYQHFSELLRDKYREIDEPPENLCLKEFDATILTSTDESFKASSIDNVFYIDTPIVIGDGKGFKESEYIWRTNLSKTITRYYENIGNNEFANRILAHIKDTVHGTIVVPSPKNTRFSSSKRLLEFQNLQGESFDLKRVATGIKSFSYIQKLIELGKLNEKSLLLIDEPEAHLHPQWIITYAYIIVLLQKYLNVTVVVSSHSPDMVQAIQEISQKEKIEENTEFYLANEISDDSNSIDDVKYEYVSEQCEVNNIFKNFNKAYLKLEDITSD